MTKTSTQGDQPESHHDQIAIRAHAIWEASGRPAGAALQHWLQAETELTVRHPKTPAHLERIDPATDR